MKLKCLYYSAKVADNRRYMLHDSTYIPVWKRQHYKDIKHTSDDYGLGGEGGLTIKGRERTIWGDGPASCHDCTCLSKLKSNHCAQNNKINYMQIMTQ